MRHWKKILTLALVATVLPETITGSTSFSALLLQPETFLFLFCIGYGIPIVLLREYAIRWKLGIGGIFLLGCAYGIYNEGFLARTFLLETNLPVNAYDTYGFFFGISWPWMFLISIWHSIASVITPIFFTFLLWPDEKMTPWIGKRMTDALAVFLVTFSMLAFFTAENDAVRTGVFREYILITLVFGAIIIAGSMRSGDILLRLDRVKVAWRPSFLIGASLLFTFFMVPAFFAGKDMPIVLFIGVCILFFYGLCLVVLSTRYVECIRYAIFWDRMLFSEFGSFRCYSICIRNIVLV